MPRPKQIPKPVEDKYTPPLTYSFVIVVGRPGSGKTTFALTLAYKAERYYSRFGWEVTTVLGNAVKPVFDAASGDVSVLIVDDADVTHPGRLRKMDSSLLNYLNRFRHKLIRQGLRYALIVFITHRWKQLLKDIRSFANVVVFKSIFMDPADNEEIMEFIGKDLFLYLKDITRKVFRDYDLRFNAYFVYKTAWGDANLARIGRPRRPSNIIDVVGSEGGEEEEKGEELNAYDIVGLLAARGWGWARIQRHALPVLRTLGYKIDNNKAHMVWRMFYEEAELELAS